MLLRQAEPADVDGYISAAAAAAMNSSEDQPPQDTTTAPRTDPLDDVFGSDNDDSPVFEDDFDNGENQHIRIIGRDVAAPPAHPSDIHRLRQEHTTAGYREGITAAKARSVQAGFDEGFGLGATIGLKVGYLLGVLEGVAAALPTNPSSSSTITAEDRAEAGRLLAQARAELSLRAVFGPEYWEEDGTWRYEVGNGKGEEEEDGEGEVLFAHVAAAHPLVRKWTATVEDVVRRWGLEEQLPLLQRSEDEDAEPVPVAARVKAVAPAQPDAKVASDALSW